MNRMGFAQRALPVLEDAVARTTDKELKEHVVFMLFESFLDVGGWQRAERVYPAASRGLTTREQSDWLGRVAVTAAEAGAKPDAMRIWKQMTTVNPAEMRGLEALAKAGLRDEWIERDMERDPVVRKARAISLVGHSAAGSRAKTMAVKLADRWFGPIPYRGGLAAGGDAEPPGEPTLAIKASRRSQTVATGCRSRGVMGEITVINLVARSYRLALPIKPMAIPANFDHTPQSYSSCSDQIRHGRNTFRFLLLRRPVRGGESRQGSSEISSSQTETDGTDDQSG